MEDLTPKTQAAREKAYQDLRKVGYTHEESLAASRQIKHVG